MKDKVKHDKGMRNLEVTIVYVSNNVLLPLFQNIRYFSFVKQMYPDIF
jgi:hypothetical protein